MFFKKISETQKNVFVKDIIFFAVIWAALNIFSAVYMLKTRSIYFWDSATYWSIIRGIASGSINHTPKDIYDSIAALDYNYIAALPGAVWTRVFGETRLSYIMGLTNMYLIPALIAVYIISKRISKRAMFSEILVILLIPTLIFLTVIGFTDVGGIFPCMICMYLYFVKDDDKDELWRFAVIGALLVFVILWRRWFAFFSVSFIAASFADALIFRKKILPPIITAVTSGIILMLFFRNFVFQKLLTDYSALYAGYKFSMSVDFKLITRYFGVITLLAAGVGSVLSGIYKKEKRVVFLWTQMLVCFVMFTSTQTHGQQHLLLYIPSLIMLAIILSDNCDDKRVITAISVLAILNTANVYIPRTQPGSIREIKHYAVIPDFSMLPVVKEGTDDIIKLKHTLDNFVEEGKTLGVLASSFTINDDILRNVEPSVGIKPEREDYIIALPQVDSRDKDMTPLYNADYIIAAFPPQTHLEPENQRVITQAVASFAEFSDFAHAFEEIPEMNAGLQNIELKLYRRIRDVSEIERAEFEEKLNN
ncbi:MAG: hypothetical protein J1F64_08295 [Oscillospiraceae bacterium]|nr:hypothetical protein [Oscillospiraceae bacterium]